MNWIDVAKALPVGGHKKIGHDCGPGLCLVVFHNDNKYSAYCHRCGPQPPEWKPLPTLAERAAKAKEQETAEALVAADRRPPMPAVYDLDEWPVEARLWLFKAGLSRTEVTQGGFYYHPTTRRVVIPVVVNGSLVYWQARQIFGSAGAKYLSMPGGREACVPVFGSGQGIVLVEDLLSAYKIQTAGFRSLCLMGTKLLPLLWEFLLHEDDITIWLDPDRAGRDAAGEIRTKLQLVGKACRDVCTKRDPKFHSKAEIARILGVPDGRGPVSGPAS